MVNFVYFINKTNFFFCFFSTHRSLMLARPDQAHLLITNSKIIEFISTKIQIHYFILLHYELAACTNVYTIAMDGHSSDWFTATRILPQQDKVTGLLNYHYSSFEPRKINSSGDSSRQFLSICGMFAMRCVYNVPCTRFTSRQWLPRGATGYIHKFYYSGSGNRKSRQTSC